ncbi:MAG: LuxR C-terminal-related transcriptional regulator [Reyranellaceae bacterium]
MSRHWIVDGERGNTRINARSAANLIGAIGNPDHACIASAMLAVVRDAGIRSEACSFYAFEPDAPPRHVASANIRDLTVSNSIAEQYVHEYYKYDGNRAFFAANPRRRASAPLIVTRQISEKISRVDYRRTCYDSVGIADRLSVVVPLKSRAGLTVSIYRRRAEGPYEDSDIHGFQEAAGLIGHAAAKHYMLSAERTFDFPALFQSRLEAIGRNLTPREFSVVRGTVRGMTVAQISDELQIKPTSVLTYRNRAYQRLGVRLKSELCALLLGQPQ